VRGGLLGCLIRDADLADLRPLLSSVSLPGTLLMPCMGENDRDSFPGRPLLNSALQVGFDCHTIFDCHTRRVPWAGCAMTVREKHACMSQEESELGGQGALCMRATCGAPCGVLGQGPLIRSGL
jgi:hypothetical protein